MTTKNNEECFCDSLKMKIVDLGAEVDRLTEENETLESALTDTIDTLAAIKKLIGAPCISAAILAYLDLDDEDDYDYEDWD